MMRTVGRVVTISRVELLRFLRERSNIFFVFVLPLALVIFIGLQFGAGASTQLGAVTSDDAAARVLVERIDASDTIDVVPIASADELRSLVSRGNLSGGVVIGEGFDRALDSGAPFEIGYVGRPDGTGQSLRSVVDAAVADHSAVSHAARIAADASGPPLADPLA
ncbi:MAG: ABC transporter permease, partial [Actinomycetota bacterium]